LPELHRQMLDTLGIRNAAKLIPLEDDFKPADPVSENMNAINGKPLKAFIYQDHEAHLKVHMNAMTDPVIQQTIGQNPKANMIFAAMQAHIAEHVGFAYRKKIEEALGMPLPAPGEEMPEELELQVSRLVAEASGRVLAESQAKVAQQKAQQTAQDPIVQMQQQELALKAKETEIKEKKMLAEAAAKADEIELRQKELLMKAAQAADELELKGQIEGAKMGIDIRKSQAQAARPKGGNTK